jgi:hypothetical protein
VRLLTAAALLLLLASPARAHVAPSEDANNRYLKLTPTGDRVRLAYTVFMGQTPGRRERARLDRDRDGSVSDAEAATFRDRLAEDVASALTVTVDGQPVPVTWAQRHIGMGTPSVAAGAFSVDLVAWLCFPGPGPRHRLELRDRFRLAAPGDTEVRVEQSPGVTVTRSVLASSAQSMLDFKWVGDAAYLHDGLQVDLEVGPDAPPADETCANATATTAGAAGGGAGGWGWKPWGLGVGAVAVATLIALALMKRRSTTGSRTGS